MRSRVTPWHSLVAVVAGALLAGCTGGGHPAAAPTTSAAPVTSTTSCEAEATSACGPPPSKAPSPPPFPPEPTTTTPATTACTASAVAVGADYGGGLTAGQFAVFVQLTPRTTCSLYRMVGVAMIEPDGGVVTDATSYTRDPNASSDHVLITARLTTPITIPADDTFGVTGQWGDVCSPGAQPPFRIRVTFADGTAKVVVPAGPFVQGGVGPPACQRTPGGALPDGRLSLFGFAMSRLVDGAGTVFQRPAQPASHPFASGTDCHVLVTAGWSGQCGVIDSPGARAVWVAEAKDPAIYAATSAQIWRLSPDGATATLALRQDDPQSTLRAARVDPGDGDRKVVFVTRLVGTRHLANIDVVEPDGVVVVHRGLSDGAVRVTSDGLETWGRDVEQDPQGPFVNESVQYNALAASWTIIPGYLWDPTKVPNDTL